MKNTKIRILLGVTVLILATIMSSCAKNTADKTISDSSMALAEGQVNQEASTTSKNSKSAKAETYWLYFHDPLEQWQINFNASPLAPDVEFEGFAKFKSKSHESISFSLAGINELPATMDKTKQAFSDESLMSDWMINNTLDYRRMKNLEIESITEETISDQSFKRMIGKFTNSVVDQDYYFVFYYGILSTRTYHVYDEVKKENIALQELPVFFSAQTYSKDDKEIMLEIASDIAHSIREIY